MSDICRQISRLTPVSALDPAWHDVKLREHRIQYLIVIIRNLLILVVDERDDLVTPEPCVADHEILALDWWEDQSLLLV